MYDTYLKVEECKFGKGLFITTDVPANTPIVEIRGKVYTQATLPDPNSPYILQIGTDSFMFEMTKLNFINHSCNPNCYIQIIGNRAVLYSLYLIKGGSELTFDYSTTSTDSLDQWKMNCQCGDFKCRKVISGFQQLDQTTQSKMKDRGMIPLYLLQPQMFQK
jgi:hypothetical protein